MGGADPPVRRCALTHQRMDAEDVVRVLTPNGTSVEAAPGLDAAAATILHTKGSQCRRQVNYVVTSVEETSLSTSV